MEEYNKERELANGIAEYILNNCHADDDMDFDTITAAVEKQIEERDSLSEMKEEKVNEKNEAGKEEEVFAPHESLKGGYYETFVDFSNGMEEALKADIYPEYGPNAQDRYHPDMYTDSGTISGNRYGNASRIEPGWVPARYPDVTMTSEEEAETVFETIDEYRNAYHEKQKVLNENGEPDKAEEPDKVGNRIILHGNEKKKKTVSKTIDKAIKFLNEHPWLPDSKSAAVMGRLTAQMNAEAKAENGNKILATVHGCRKIKVSLIKKLGEIHASRMIINAVIYLARNQTVDGHVETNVNVMSYAIGCNKSYFMDLIHELEFWDIIKATRSADPNRCKNGVWHIYMADNDFSNGYKGEENRYVTLAPEIFASKDFMQMRVIDKFIVLSTFATFHPDSEMSTQEWNKLVADEKDHPFTIDYKGMIARCEEWSGLGHSACVKAYRRISKRWDIERPKDSYSGNRFDLQYEVPRLLRIPKEDAQILDTDNFVYLTNLVLVAMEEDGVHLARIYYSIPEKERVSFLEWILKLSGPDRDRIKTEMQNFQDANMVRDLAYEAGCFNRETKKRIYELKSGTRDICYRATHCSPRFNYNHVTKHFSPLMTRQTMSTIVLTSEEMPVFIKTCVMDLVTSFKYLEYWTTHNMHLSMSDIDVFGSLGDTLNLVRNADKYQGKGNKMAKIITRHKKEQKAA